MIWNLDISRAKITSENTSPPLDEPLTADAIVKQLDKIQAKMDLMQEFYRCVVDGVDGPHKDLACMPSWAGGHREKMNPMVEKISLLKTGKVKVFHRSRLACYDHCRRSRRRKTSTNSRRSGTLYQSQFLVAMIRLYASTASQLSSGGFRISGHCHRKVWIDLIYTYIFDSSTTSRKLECRDNSKQPFAHRVRARCHRLRHWTLSTVPFDHYSGKPLPS